LRREERVSKKQGVTAVKASSTLDPADFLARWEATARQRRFRLERYGAVPIPASPATAAPASDAAEAEPAATLPLVASTRRTPGVRPRIYVSSGIHGDEPAGPEALLQLLADDVFDSRATWLLAPLLNPIGFLRRTRENADPIDLNRDYHVPRTMEVRAHIAWLERQPPFDLALCLHEDWEATGFYLYELNPENLPSLAPAFLAAAARHLPVEPATVIDGRPITAPGLIRPDHDPRLRDLWAEAIYLQAHHTTLCYTLETPSAAPLPVRIAALVSAVRAGLDTLFTR
jgi:murein peptide amidase A